jgi:hypothetical protein
MPAVHSQMHILDSRTARDHYGRRGAPSVGRKGSVAILHAPISRVQYAKPRTVGEMGSPARNKGADPAGRDRQLHGGHTLGSRLGSLAHQEGAAGEDFHCVDSSGIIFLALLGFET